MTSASPIKVTISAVLSLGLLVAPLVAKAGIVVASSGPSAERFPAGTKLPDSSQITLKEGDSVTILGNGGTRVLKGAGTFTVGLGRTTRRNSTFAALTRQRSSPRVRTGAVRNAGSDEPPRSPNLWYIDVHSEGTMCIVNTDAVLLWRADTSADERFTVQAADGTSTAIVNFHKGSMLASWDVAETPVSNGATYTIKKTGISDTKPIVFAVLPEQQLEAEDLAAVLIEKGCQTQLKLLAGTLETSSR